MRVVPHMVVIPCGSPINVEITQRHEIFHAWLRSNKKLQSRCRNCGYETAFYERASPPVRCVPGWASAAWRPGPRTTCNRHIRHPGRLPWVTASALSATAPPQSAHRSRYRRQQSPRTVSVSVGVSEGPTCAVWREDTASLLHKWEVAEDNRLSNTVFFMFCVTATDDKPKIHFHRTNLSVCRELLL